MASLGGVSLSDVMSEIELAKAGRFPCGGGVYGDYLKKYPIGDYLLTVVKPVSSGFTISMAGSIPLSCSGCSVSPLALFYKDYYTADRRAVSAVRGVPVPEYLCFPCSWSKVCFQPYMKSVRELVENRFDYHRYYFGRW